MWNNLLFLLCFLAPFSMVIYSFEENHNGQPSPNDTIYAKDGAGVWEFPTGCSSDCKKITWIPVSVGGNLMMKFTLTSSNLGYIAVAFSHDRLMGYDHAYICMKTNRFSNVLSAFLTGHTFPTNITTVKSASVDYIDGQVKCTFLRPMIVVAKVLNFTITWDLAINNYNLLYAEGKLHQFGLLLPHTFHATTHRSFDLHRSEKYLSPPDDENANNGLSLRQNQLSQNSSITVNNMSDSNATQYPTTSKTNTQSIGARSNGLEDINDALSVPVHHLDHIYTNAYGTRGMWFVANETDCPDGDNCKQIYWEKAPMPGKPDLVKFVMVGKPNRWMALAISNDTEMGNDDSYICASFRDNVLFSSVNLNATGLPTISSQVTRSSYHAVLIHNRLKCEFYRNVSVTKNIMGQLFSWDLSKNDYNLVYMEGNLGSRGEFLRNSFVKSTNQKFNLLSTKGYKNLRDVIAPSMSVETEATHTVSEESTAIYTREQTRKITTQPSIRRTTTKTITQTITSKTSATSHVTATTARRQPSNAPSPNLQIENMHVRSGARAGPNNEEQRNNKTFQTSASVQTTITKVTAKTPPSAMKHNKTTTSKRQPKLLLHETSTPLSQETKKRRLSSNEQKLLLETSTPSNRAICLSITSHLYYCLIFIFQFVIFS